MPTHWQLEDLKQEITAMVEMLGKRGEQCTSMATSLVKQLENKMKASKLSTSEILQLTQHLEGSGLPDGCKDNLLAQCDQLVLQDSHQSAVALTMKAQTCDHLTNYLTAGDWASLKNDSFWKGANVLIHRLKKIGVKRLNECLKKRCIGVLVITEMEKGKPFPRYRDIYDMAQKFAGAFSSSTYQAAPGVPSILNYPMQPAMVSDTFVATAYEENDPPVLKHLEDLNFLVLHHLPVRNTSKLLQEDSSQVVIKKSKRKGAEASPQDDLEDRVTSNLMHKLGSKLDQLLDRTGAVTPVARPALSDSMPQRDDGSALSNLRPKALLALPSQNSFTSSEAKQDSPGQQPVVEPPATTLALPAPPQAIEATGKSADELGKEAFLELQRKEQAKKDSQKGKAAKNKAPKAFAKGKAKAKAKQASKAVLKPTKGGPVLKRPAAKVSLAAEPEPAPLPQEPQSDCCYGCLRCRGNVKGCDMCRKEGFNGLRCNGREAWKTALGKQGKSWK